MPPDTLFETSMTISKTSFLQSQQNLAPDVVFGATLQQQASNPKGRLIRTTLPGTRDATWGFAMQGCMLPLLTLRVSWQKTAERQQGQSTTANENKKVVCWQRVISVLSVTESDVRMSCTMRFSSNGLRAMLASAAIKFNDVNLQRQDVINYIAGQVAKKAV